MNLKNLVRAIFYPVTEPAVLLAMIVFSALLMLAEMAGLLGIWLAIAVIPAVFRYQMVLLEARARGVQPEPPGAEFFSWANNGWTLFPFVIVVGFGGIAWWVKGVFGDDAMYVVLVLQGFIYPAMIGVLAITYSPLQSLNPVATYRFITSTGVAYVVAPAYMFAIGLLVPLLTSMNTLLAGLIEMFFVFSLHSVIGTVIEPVGIVDDIDIPDALEPDEATIAETVEATRASALTHAYGFITHDNRSGGFEHIFESIRRDPNPAAAWRWYFERMLQWDESNHALFFAQYYIRDLLRHGEMIPAQKLTMRCLMLNEQFRPFPEDIPVLIEVAEDTRNDELATVLKGM